MAAFISRLQEFALECVRNWVWMVPLVFNSFFLYKIVSAFLPVKPRRGWKTALAVLLGGTTGMVIWIGDNNLLLTLPVFFAVFLACSRGDFKGRIAITAIFFCLIMTVSAVLDTYYANIMHTASWDDFFHYSSKFIRPIICGLSYLAVRKNLPERPPRLSPRLWNLVLLLSSLPICALLAVVVSTYENTGEYWTPAAHSLAQRLGIIVLPFVFLTCLALLYTVWILEKHERLEELEKLSELRSAYYQSLRREETQLRTIRHDLRNHLTAIRGLVADGELRQALDYIDQLSGSPAVQGGRRLCANDTANAVLSAKAEAMRREGIRADIAVSLPESFPLDGVDLCALLGNALDNAIEAAAQAPDRWITVRCRIEKGLFMLRVENASAEVPRPDLTTSKEDKSAHGFGLPGMREIAERCGGSLETRARPGKFELVACLPLNP